MSTTMSSANTTITNALVKTVSPVSMECLMKLDAPWVLSIRIAPFARSI